LRQTSDFHMKQLSSNEKNAIKVKHCDPGLYKHHSKTKYTRQKESDTVYRRNLADNFQCRFKH